MAFITTITSEIQRFDIILNAQCCEDVWTCEPTESDRSPDKEGTNTHIYKPGGHVEGTLHVLVTEPINFTGIYICAQGRLFVGFNVGDDSGPESHEQQLSEKDIKDYTAEKEYVVLPRQQLYGNVMGQTQLLPPGEHQFPFKFDIPTTIPSSFNGRLGFIEYWIDATIDQTPFGKGLNRREDIIIHGYYDLSLEPSFLVPYESSKDENYCCLCCQDGVYGYSLVLPKRGFCHGEKIRPSIELRNLSPSSAVASLKLIMKVEYEAGIKTASEEKEQLSECSVKVESQTSHQWEPELPIVELLPTSKLSQSSTRSNIKIDYKLKFQFSPNGCNCDQMDLSIDIRVGHLPQMFASQPLPVMTQPQTFVYPAVDLSVPQVPPECRPLLPPPCEKGGNFGNQDIRPPAEPTAPPVIHQPYSMPGLSFGDGRPAPPSYAECFAMTDLYGATGPSYPVPERYIPPSAPDSTYKEEEGEKRDWP